MAIRWRTPTTPSANNPKEINDWAVKLVNDLIYNFKVISIHDHLPGFGGGSAPINVQEDSAAEGSVHTLNFSTNLDVAVAANVATITLDTNPSITTLTASGYISCDNFTKSYHYTGFPNRTDTSIAWDDGTYTLTLTATNDIVWINGKSYTINTLTKQLTVAQEAATGLYYFWITAPGGVPQLNCSDTAMDIGGAGANAGFDQCMVGIVYWNTTTNKGVLTDERHWFGRDAWNHEYLHETIGARWYTGGTITPTNTTFAITQCEFYDEDIEHILTAATACRVYYHNGSAAWAWDDNNVTPYKLNGTSMRYNNGTALADVATSKYLCIWFYATGTTTYPFAAFIGDQESNTIAAARALSPISLGTQPSLEMKLLYKLIYQQGVGSVTYVEATDYRQDKNLAGNTFTAASHLLLTDLATGDSGHTQFALLAGRSGGQILVGGSDAGDDLTLKSTSHGTKGYIFLGESGTSGPLINDSDDLAGAWTFDALATVQFNCDVTIAAAKKLTSGGLDIATDLFKVNAAGTGLIDSVLANGEHFVISIPAGGVGTESTAHVTLPGLNAGRTADAIYVTLGYSGIVTDLYATRVIGNLTTDGGHTHDFSGDTLFTLGTCQLGASTLNGQMDANGQNIINAASLEIDATTPTITFTGDTHSATFLFDDTNDELQSNQHLAVMGQKYLLLYDADNSAYVGFKAPAAVTQSWVYTLPAAKPASDKVLQSDSSGVLSWADTAAHNLLSATHGDTTAASPTRGDIITAQDASPTWKRLAKGSQYTVLKMNANEPEWGSVVNANVDTSAAIATTKLGAGAVVQVVNALFNAYSSGSGTIPADDTIPQKTEGNEFMTLAITPTNANNKLLIRVVANTGGSVVVNIVMALFQDTTANALAATWDVVPLTTSNMIIPMEYYMTAGTTSATTFKIRIGLCSGGTTYFNGIGSRYLGTSMCSSITITEIAV